MRDHGVVGCDGIVGDRQQDHGAETGVGAWPGVMAVAASVGRNDSADGGQIHRGQERAAAMNVGQ